MSLMPMKRITFLGSFLGSSLPTMRRHPRCAISSPGMPSGSLTSGAPSHLSKYRREPGSRERSVGLDHAVMESPYTRTSAGSFWAFTRSMACKFREYSRNQRVPLFLCRTHSGTRCRGLEGAARDPRAKQTTRSATRMSPTRGARILQMKNSGAPFRFACHGIRPAPPGKSREKFFLKVSSRIRVTRVTFRILVVSSRVRKHRQSSAPREKRDPHDETTSDGRTPSGNRR